MKNSSLAIALAIIGLILLVASFLAATGYFKPKKGKLIVESVGITDLFINDNPVGRTPYEAELREGSYQIRIGDWNGTVNILGSLTSSVIVIKEAAQISSQILDYRDGIAGKSSLLVLSTPDNAQVYVDGISKGFAPLKLDNLTAINYQVQLKVDGYRPALTSLNLAKGRVAVLRVELLREEIKIEPTATPVPKQEFVKIGDTPNDFLRVRDEPDVNSLEVGRVEDGETLLLVSTSSDGDWYEIEYEEGKSGWISAGFAQKIETPL